MIRRNFLYQFLLAVICSIFSFPAMNAQRLDTQISAHTFPFTHALYTNEVKTVYQDTEGYIWLGTTSGVARWDGYRLVTLRNDWRDSNLLTSNDIHCMADASGLLWMGSPKGVTCYHQHNGQFSKPIDTQLCTLYINDVKADGKGGLWIACNQHVYHWDGNDSLRTEKVNPFDGICTPCDINTLFCDSHGRLFVVCHDNVLLKLEQQTGHPKVTRIPPIPDGGNLLFLYEDMNGRFWVGTWGYGLWQLLPDGAASHDCWKQQDVSLSADRKEDHSVFGMVEGNGLLWLLTYERLHALRNDAGRLVDVRLDDVMPTNKMFTKIIRDREGNLWLSAYDDSYTIRFNTPGIQGYRLPSLARLLQHDANLKGLLSDGSYVWLNQDRFGILLMNLETGEITDGMSQKWEEMSLLVPSRRPHSAWVGKRYGTVATLLTHDGMTVRTVEQIDVSTTESSASYLIALHEDEGENLWLLTLQHLFLRNKVEGTLLVAQHHEPFTAMTPCHDGHGVLCADRKGLYRCTLTNGSIACTPLDTDFSLIGDETVTHLSNDGDGCLWIITSLGRIIRSNRPLKNFETLSLTEYLVGEEVQDLRHNGNTMWLMTDKRLVEYDIQTGATRTYPAGQNDICVHRFLLNALDVDSAGYVLAGGYGGFVRIDSKVTDSQPLKAPIPIVTDFLVNGYSVFFTSEADTGNTFRRVTLPCDAQNIEIHLSTLTYATVVTPQVQYRLDGIDADWIPADKSNPMAFYNHLPRGTHMMHVRILQPDGTWSEGMEAITITRQPYWYETWWAFTLYALLAVLLLTLVILYIRRRQARKLHAEVTQAKMNVLSNSHPFTDELISVIHQHIDDSSFGVEELASAMSSSKSTLNRRLKAEIDMTPLELMNSVRLKQACQLLMDDHLTVSEVAYAVGFNSPNYFTRCFKTEFGTTPREYKQHRTEGQNPT